MSGTLRTSVATVTGGASRIGSARAKLPAARGARVALVDSYAHDGLSLAAQISAGPCFLETDVSSEESVATAVSAVMGRYGRLRARCWISSESWKCLNQVNLRDVFLRSRAAMPHLQAFGAGSIVNISSILGVVGDPGLVACGAMKGLIASTESIPAPRSLMTGNMLPVEAALTLKRH